jgi:CubicO group peptidase (beta-lactamase class C family)
MNIKNINRDYWPTSEWQFAKPNETGMDPCKLNEIEKIIETQHGNINGIIIVRKGYIVFEKYFNGFSPEDTHNIASVTKSFTSALIGIAIDSGYLKTIDQKVLEFFPEYTPGADDFLKRAITIKHILTMTAPIASKTVGNKWEALDRLRRQKDWIKYILDQLGKTGRIGEFQYSTAGAHILSAIITKVTGKSLRDFANEKLFKPIGIKEIPDHEMKTFLIDDVFGKRVTGWIKDPQGYTLGGMGLNINVRDMARFGFLYLNNGQWNDQQIISEKWITDSTNMNINKYGFLWWLIETGNTTAYTAAGSGGSHIYCIPDKDLVIAIASKIIPKPKDRWPLVEDYIIPSIME